MSECRSRRLPYLRALSILSIAGATSQHEWMSIMPHDHQLVPVLVTNLGSNIIQEVVCGCRTWRGSGLGPNAVVPQVIVCSHFLMTLWSRGLTHSVLSRTASGPERCFTKVPPNPCSTWLQHHQKTASVASFETSHRFLLSRIWWHGCN